MSRLAAELTMACGHLLMRFVKPVARSTQAQIQVIVMGGQAVAVIVITPWNTATIEVKVVRVLTQRVTVSSLTTIIKLWKWSVPSTILVK